jgi:hypothetical protein
MASRLREFGPNIWTVDGPVVDFYGFPYPTRMVVIQIKSKKQGGVEVWIWSPVAFSEELGQEVETLGPVAHLVSPNLIHWLFLKSWQERYPNATVYASPGLRDRKFVVDLRFDITLGEDELLLWPKIDQVIFKGSLLDEVVFFHYPSKTVIFCDLIQRHPEESQTGWKGWLMRLDGLVGFYGSTPREWRLSFWWNGQQHLTRRALDKVLLEWQPERLIVAHGDCAFENATELVEKCLHWVPKNPRPRCGCIPGKATMVDDDKEN